MFGLKSIKKGILLSSVAAASIFTFNGCLEERALQNDELISIYNSNMEKTNKLHPLDTMYGEFTGLKENSRYEVRILDSDRNEITTTHVLSDDTGSIEKTAIWYDIGVAKPDSENPTYHIKKYDGLGMKSFYINVKDLETNGNITDFEQPFFYVVSNDSDYPDYPKPIIYACNSNGVIENAFEETGSKDIDGEDSLLTKVHLKVDTLPTKDDKGEDVLDVDVYVIPYSGILSTDKNISELNYKIKKEDVSISSLKSETGVEIWNLNDANNSLQLVNPNEDNTAYSIIVDLNKDGIYTVGTDLNNDDLTDRYIDAVDGGDVPGFIVQNTHANEQSYFLSNSAGEKLNSVPECFDNRGGSVYINIDNISTSSSSLDVNVDGTNVVVDVLEPSYDDTTRYMKYVNRSKIFDSCSPEYNVADNSENNLTVEVPELDITSNIIVYSVDSSLLTGTQNSETTTFDETGTVNGDKQVYLKVTSDLGTATGDVYLFDHNITWTEGTSITGELFVKNDVDLSNGANSLIIDLESDVSIINPKQNNGMFDFVIDYDKDGVFDSNDKVVSLTVRDTVANDAPNVGYINIASRGFNHDNHYTHSDNLSDYGYIDEFKKDGSNTHYGCCGSTKGVKVIWNPYIKNITKSGGYFTNAGYPNSGSVTTYVDQNSVEQESPFNYGQRINIYIIDAEVNKLKANLELDNIDVRGYGSTHTVQYSCSNGAGQQTIWRPNMDVGKYYLILDMDMDGKITEGVDFIDAVDQTGKKITEDSSVVGFSVID